MILELVQVLATRLSTEVRGILAQARALGAAGADTGEQFDDLEVVTPLGFDSRPEITDNLEGVLYRDGQDGYVLALIDKGRAKLTDLEVGETRISGAKQSNITARIRIRAAGNLQLASKSGQAIELMGAGATADKPVAHEGSATAGHTHDAGTYVAGPYPVTALSGSSTDTIDTGQGSANVKVPNT